MKKFFTTFAAAAVAGFAVQGAPANYAQRIQMQAPEVSDEVIYEMPEGELSWLDRTCDGFVTVAFEATHDVVRGSVVQRVDGEDGYVYLSHMASEYPVNTWTRFEKEGDTLVMEGIQAIYEEYDDWYDETLVVYLAPMEVVVNENNVGTFKVTDNCRYVLNIGEDGSLTAADPKMVLGVCVRTLDEELEGNDIWIWKGFGDRDVKMAPLTAEPVSIPEGIEVANWVMTDEYVNEFVQVAVDGDDIYVCGLDRSIADAWVKGTLSDGKAVFPSGQYLGADMDIYYYSYFCGAEFLDELDEEGVPVRVCRMAENAVFDYDAELGKLTSGKGHGYIINSTAAELYPLYFYEDVTVGVQHRNPEAVPQAAYNLEYFYDEWGSSVWFQLPKVDVEGNILLTDNLYYEVYVNGVLQYYDIFDEDWNVENTYRIPYMYNDYEDFWVSSDFPEDHTVSIFEEDVTSIGIRSIYVNENGEEIYSETAYWGDPVGVEAIDVYPVDVKWYDLQGRRITGRTPGVAVKVTSFSDGTARREKVMAK